MWKRAVKSTVLIGILSIAALQFVPGPKRSNPPLVAGRSLFDNAVVPRHIQDVLRRSCMDCHSNETRWPWYSHIAPLSWGVTSDVARARRAINFSEWSVQAGRTPASAAGTLMAMCAGVSSGRMPPEKYTLLHGQARLTVQERQAVCEWAHAETRRQIAANKKLRILRTKRD
jgi:hypothetical protein